MILKNDCKHFPGDRPCKPHKETGIKCDVCPYYTRRGKRILIIKLDAVGDVLRTTSILTPFREKYPDCEISWITKPEAMPIFDNNPLVDMVLPWNHPHTFAFAQNQQFDIIINLDASPLSSLLASAASAVYKFGFGLDSRGYVIPYNSHAEEWLEMGAFDDVKQANTKTYQRIMFEILGLDDVDKYPVIIHLDRSEIAFATDFAARNGIRPDSIKVGLNTGAGGRWKMKKWTEPGYAELIRRLVDHENIQILLYGGPLERERNASLSRISPKVIDTGSDNSLREFFALLSLSGIVVTGDTLALHAAVALKKRIVAMFGPTSYNEIELYGQGEKIYPGMECLGCYLADCDVPRKCMDRITAGEVLASVERQIEIIEKQG